MGSFIAHSTIKIILKSGYKHRPPTRGSLMLEKTLNSGWSKNEMRVTFPIIKLLFKIFLNLGGEPRGLIAKLFFLLCPLFILKSAHAFRLNCSFIGFWCNRRVQLQFSVSRWWCNFSDDQPGEKIKSHLYGDDEIGCWSILGCLWLSDF